MSQLSREEMRLYMANRRRERRERVLDILGAQCNKCGSLQNLEVNHIDRTKKNFGLSGKGLDNSWPNILIELENCELLCSMCHEEYTATQYANEEIVPVNKGVRLEYLHGTARTYLEAKCRCDSCKKARSLNRKGLIKYSDVVA